MTQKDGSECKEEDEEELPDDGALTGCLLDDNFKTGLKHKVFEKLKPSYIINNICCIAFQFPPFEEMKPLRRGDYPTLSDHHAQIEIMQPVRIK